MSVEERSAIDQRRITHCQPMARHPHLPHSAFGGGHRAAVKAAWGGLPPVDHTMAVARWERLGRPCEAAVASQDSTGERRHGSARR